MPYNFSATVNTTSGTVGSSSNTTYWGFTVKAAAGNSGKVYIGNSSSVSAGTTAATDGFELSASEAFAVSRAFASDPSQCYVIASTSSQKIFVIGD